MQATGQPGLLEIGSEPGEDHRPWRTVYFLSVSQWSPFNEGEENRQVLLQHTSKVKK